MCNAYIISTIGYVLNIPCTTTTGGKMDTEHKEYVKQEWERVNSLVDTLTLFDDELMGRVFDKNT